MGEKIGNKCDKHNLDIEKFVQRNEDGTIELVDACEKCALILKGAGLKLEKKSEKVNNDEIIIDKNLTAMGVPRKEAEESIKKHDEHFKGEEPYWD